MKNPIKWLRWKLEYRRLINQLLETLGDRKLFLVADDIEEGDKKK